MWFFPESVFLVCVSQMHVDIGRGDTLRARRWHVPSQAARALLADGGRGMSQTGRVINILASKMINIHEIAYFLSCVTFTGNWISQVG